MLVKNEQPCDSPGGDGEAAVTPIAVAIPIDPPISDTDTPAITNGASLSDVQTDEEARALAALHVNGALAVFVITVSSTCLTIRSHRM
jgi:hypothetical protein